MQIHVPSALVGAGLVAGAGLLLAAQAPLIGGIQQAVANIAVTEIKRPVQLAPSPSQWVRVEEDVEYFVPAGKRFVLDSVIRWGGQPQDLWSSDALHVLIDGTIAFAVNGFPVHSSKKFPDGLSLVGGQSIRIEHIAGTFDPGPCSLLGYLAPE